MPAVKEGGSPDSECLTPDHEVLTDAGWVGISDVKTSHLVATLGHGRGVEWQNPLAAVSYEYDGDLAVADGRYIRFRATMRHRFWLYTKRKGTDLYCKTAKSILDGCAPQFGMMFPVCAKNPQADYGISDADIGLAAWILTDGCISSGISIYQSKSHNFNAIRSILSASGEAWVESTRHRAPPVIDGVQVKSTKPEMTFRLTAESSKRVAFRLFGIEGYVTRGRHKKAIPPWVHRLSARQFGIFIESIIDGDGARLGGARTLYGRKEFLDEMQGLLCVNGYRVLMSTKSSKASGRVYNCLSDDK